MKYCIAILAFMFVSFRAIPQAKSPQQTNNKARITFIAKEGDRGKTYTGKLIKGDLAGLKFELNQSAGISNIQGNNQSQNASEKYVNRVISSSHGKKSKKRAQRAENDLTGHYEINSKEELEKVKEKKEEAVQNRYERKNKPGFFERLFTPRKQPKKQQLSDRYKISKKRIRNGQTIKRQAGPITLIVTYKIRENGFVNTYIDVVEYYLQPGSDYQLKYHGTGAKRNYYIEYVPQPGH
ncbi:MAG: hypothetical protein K9H26_17335 [Prolixibacteraceae bacterium]|nr:hypothetical protein [Prolixibacteraceae bacterium]